jgi:aspartyl-tRNA(Asn)/glutamyl-tRNA(Gln) amidotransferase subunit A
VAKTLDEALATFRGLGARVVEVDLPDQTALSAAALIVLAVEATSLHAPWLRQRAGDYGAQVRNRLQNGLAYSAVEYLTRLCLRPTRHVSSVAPIASS